MLSRLLRRLTYANVIATLALFIALGTGGAYAAATLTGADIVDESLTGADVQGTPAVNGSLTGFDIADGSIQTADLGARSVGNGKLADSSVSSPKIADGTVTSADLSPGALNGVARGQTAFAREVIPASGGLFFPGGIPGFFFVGTICSAGFPEMTLDNQTDEPIDVVRADASATTPSYRQLGPQSSPDFRWDINLATGPNVQEFHLSTPSGRSATVWVSSSGTRAASNDCVETVQAVATK